MGERLANYTTTVSAERSIAEITGLLVSYGAKSLSFDYVAATPVAVRFVVDVGGSPLSFALPCDWKGARSILQNMRKRGYVDDAHARNVAWRCIRDWLRAQLALIEIGAAKLDQVMLPYAVLPGGETVYERFVLNEFGRKALPAAEGCAE